MKLDYLREFDTCARLLNMHSAADLLFIAQSSLSKHMKALEKEIGCSLLSYSENKIRLTRQGVFFLEGIQPILAEYDKLLSGSQGGETSKVDVEDLVLIAQQHSSIDKTTEAYYAFIDSFAKRHPSFVIHFARKARQTFDEKARNGAIDLFIDYRFAKTQGIIEDYAAKGLVAMPLAKEELAIWCHKNNPLCDEPVHPCDLRQTPIMIPADASAPFAKAIQELGGYYGFQVLFSMAPSSSQAEFIGCHNEETVYIYPRSFLETPLFTGYSDMATIPFQEGCAMVQSYALSYPNGNAGAQAIIEYMKELLGFAAVQ